MKLNSTFSIVILSLGIVVPAADAFRQLNSSGFKAPVECYQTDRSSRVPLAICVSGKIDEETREGYGRALVSSAGNLKVAILEAGHGDVLFCKRASGVSRIAAATQFHFRDDVMIDVSPRETIARVEYGSVTVGRVELQYSKIDSEKEIEALVQRIETSGKCPK